MYCPNCGAPNADEIKRCGACGTNLDVNQVAVPFSGEVGAQVTSIAVPPVSAHLLFAVITTLFCCLPLGLVSLVYASQVQPSVDRGDYLGAQLASQRARRWALWSFGFGVLTVLLQALNGGLFVLFGL